jgi:hypothetical protein
MKSKTASAKKGIKQKQASLMVAGTSGVATVAAPERVQTDPAPFTLDASWLRRSLGNAGLIALTFMASLFLAGVLPTVFAQAFQMPKESFPANLMFSGTFLLFAIVRAGLAFRLVDQAVHIQSVGRWVLRSVLSDVGFIVLLSFIVPLMPLPFNRSGEIAWEFFCAALAGLVTGLLQWRMFQPRTKSQLLWVAFSMLTWMAAFGLIGAWVLSSGRAA